VLSGVQLMALSVIGEYIARIYVQAQARPLYNVAERLNFHPDDAVSLVTTQAPDELFRASLAPQAPGGTARANDRPNDLGDEESARLARDEAGTAATIAGTTEALRLEHVKLAKDAPS